MTIKEIIKRPEGRRLEFKEVLPEYADLAKTIVAFANDAGGELYIGVQNNPREIVGLPEEELMKIEEQVSSIIYDRCYPAVLPEITFLTDDDKHIIRVVIYRVIRNAIVHRDYSLTGKDVKVAIYDDMIEETGLSFQVQFVKLDYIARQELGQELGQELRQELRQESENPTMYSGILQKVVQTPLSRKEISESFGHKQISGGLNRTLTKLIDDKLIEHTIKDNKNHPDQKIRISKRGILFLELLKK